MRDAAKSEIFESFVKDLTGIAIVAFDVDGNIVAWNSGAQNVWSYGSAEFKGRHFSDLLSKEGVSPVNARAALDNATAWGQHEKRMRLVNKQGVELEAQVAIRPVRDATKNLVGFGLLATDFHAYSEDNARSSVAGATDVESGPSKVVLLRGAKILLVDDDDLAREQVEETLTDLGYDVVSSASGDEALEILERVADIELLMADVVMPNGIGGRELADIARHRRPDLKVLFCSGYFPVALVNAGELPRGVDCLVKPYRRTQLVQTLDRMLKLGA